MNKDNWLWLAPEYFNRWRVFPRAFIIIYFWLIVETAIWFMGIPVPTPSQAVFAGAIISAGAAWFGLYVNSGSMAISRASARQTSQKPSSPTKAAPPSETNSVGVPDYVSKGE